MWATPSFHSWGDGASEGLPPRGKLKETALKSSFKTEVMRPAKRWPGDPAESNPLSPGLLSPILEGAAGGMGKAEKSPSTAHKRPPKVPPPLFCLHPRAGVIRYSLRPLTPPLPQIPMSLQGERCPCTWQPHEPSPPHASTCLILSLHEVARNSVMRKLRLKGAP